MIYSKEYLQLQLDFAERVQAVTSKPIEECLLRYTSFYKTFIPDWDFNPDNPLWIEFINKFKNIRNKSNVIALLYEREPAPLTEKYFGCFSYKYVDEKKTVYTHFKNTGEAEGVLSEERIQARLEELKEMFTEIKEKHPQAEMVSGFSWLYNIDAYKRLFPQEYIKNSREIHGWFKTLALWGQFIDRNLNIRKDIVLKFKKCMQAKNSLEELEFCFPYKILQPKCDIMHFYKFYNI
jgi:hypothetical protein